jgi:transposase
LIADAERRLCEVPTATRSSARWSPSRGWADPAATIRAEVGRFDRFTTGKRWRVLRAVPGTPPAASGRPTPGCRAGNPQLRATIIEAAHRLIRFDPRWASLAGRLGGAGKPKSVVAAAVANRWVRWLFHQVGGGAIELKDVA